MVRFSNGPVFKWSGFSYGYSPNHSKTGPFKIRTFCLDFKQFLTKWSPFVRISNSRDSGLQIPFKIQTICNTTSFGPFKIQTGSDFRSPTIFKWSKVVPSPSGPIFECHQNTGQNLVQYSDHHLNTRTLFEWCAEYRTTI